MTTDIQATTSSPSEAAPPALNFNDIPTVNAALVLATTTVIMNGYMEQAQTSMAQEVSAQSEIASQTLQEWNATFQTLNNDMEAAAKNDPDGNPSSQLQIEETVNGELTSLQQAQTQSQEANSSTDTQGVTSAGQAMSSYTNTLYQAMQGLDSSAINLISGWS